MEEDEKDCIKIKYQLDTDKAEDFVEEITDLANKYKIRLHCEDSIISFDLAEIIKVNEIIRLKEDKKCQVKKK